MSDVKFPLWFKLVIFGSFGAFLPATIVGLGLININESTLKTQSREFRLAIAEDIAGTMDEGLAQSQQTVLTVARVLTGTELTEDQRIELALALVEGESYIDRVRVLDAEGKYIATIRQGVAENNESDLDPVLRSAAIDQRFVLGTPALDEGGHVRVSVIHALKPMDEVTGFLDASVSLERIQERVELVAGARLSATSSSTSSALYVVDDGGRVLAHSAAEKRFVPTDFDGLLGQDLGTLTRSQVAYSGESEDGVRLVSAKPLSSLPWITVVEIPLEEAYASLERMRKIVIVVVGLAILLSFLIAVIVARRITGPLAKLMEFTKSLSTRDFSARVEVNTSDEISLLASSLNGAAVELESSEKQIAREVEIRADLGRYLPKELVENVVTREQDMQLGGTRREITVLFADVVRFTPLCENMEPEQVVAILNELFTILTEIVFKHGGTIDKFLGDCIMAFWGAPTPSVDHATKALEAAEEMQTWLEVGNSRWKDAYGITVELAIGVNTGQAIIGNIGSETRMEYTAIGSAVNIAARLESLARPRQILTTDATRMAASDMFEFGKTSTELLSAGGAPVDVYEVIL